jgi:ATP-dependent RNA helicase DDX60
MAMTVLQSLQRSEKIWRESSHEWKQKIMAWEAWKINSARQARVASKSKKQRKDSDDDARLETEAVSWEQSFDPSEPSTEFSFADARKYSWNELDGDIKDLEWTSTPKWIFDALKRGIAVHHSGMSKAYRSVVERCVLIVRLS